MRQLRLSTVGALRRGRRRQAIMGTAPVTARFGGSTLWIGHLSFLVLVVEPIANRGQRCPSRIDDLLIAGAGVYIAVDAALRAKARALLAAQLSHGYVQLNLFCKNRSAIQYVTFYKKYLEIGSLEFQLAHHRLFALGLNQQVESVLDLGRRPPQTSRALQCLQVLEFRGQQKPRTRAGHLPLPADPSQFQKLGTIQGLDWHRTGLSPAKRLISNSIESDFHSPASDPAGERLRDRPAGVNEQLPYSLIPRRGIWDDDSGFTSKPIPAKRPTLSKEKPTAPPPSEEWTASQRIKRALSRRFPRLRVAYDVARGYAKWGLDLTKLLFGLLSFPRWSRSVRWLRCEVAAQLRRRREPRLTVGIEIASFWEPLTGIGWYLYRLIEHLAERDDLRMRLYGPSSVASDDLEDPVVALPAGPAIELVERGVPERLILPRGWLIRCLRALEPVAIAADRNDVLFAPNYFLPRRFDLASAARVATVHDLAFKHFAWTLRKETLDELDEKLAHAAFEATRLITVSQAVKDEVVAAGLAGADRITPIHHGPGQLAVVEPGSLPAGTPDAFGLHVGTIEPRKNVSSLLEAWQRVRTHLPDAPKLVLCGRFGWKSDETQAQVRRAEREGWLVHLGYVDDTELAALYRRALVVVFPTLYEGFGLPAVEALWADTPLVCSDLPVLREVTRGAARFATVGHPEELAQAIVEVLTDSALQAELVALGRQRVRELSWHRSADLTASVWAEAAGRVVSGTDHAEE